jgi:hypothetical protein
VGAPSASSARTRAISDAGGPSSDPAASISAARGERPEARASAIAVAISGNPRSTARRYAARRRAIAIPAAAGPAAARIGAGPGPNTTSPAASIASAPRTDRRRRSSSVGA